MKKIIFKIIPVAKPRMVKSDIWSGRKAVGNYWAFKDELNILTKQKGYKIGNTLDIKFYLPMPDSWSEKKKKLWDGEVHCYKPDFDNLVKAFTDSLMKNDSCLYDVRVRKYWARTGSIEVFL